jgi:hypothetical protein
MTTGQIVAVHVLAIVGWLLALVFFNLWLLGVTYDQALH